MASTRVMVVASDSLRIRIMTDVGVSLKVMT